jgi:hypothetical protein
MCSPQIQVVAQLWLERIFTQVNQILFRLDPLRDVYPHKLALKSNASGRSEDRNPRRSSIELPRNSKTTHRNALAPIEVLRVREISHQSGQES